MVEYPCTYCNGARVVENRAQQLQACPICEGTGFEPGEERFFTYIYQVTLTALQVLLNQRIVTNGDADFRIKLNTRTATGGFRIRLFNNEGQYYSSSGEGGTNDRVRDSLIFGDGSLPFIVVPHIFIPKGGSIGFDLEDVSNANNTIQLAFSGAKVYPPRRAPKQ
ncbi:MAG: hypothetical protein IPK75_20545 [Acidobacteria bacterium]|nr:hypothetical protein [Acidobacteriota bacterium]